MNVEAKQSDSLEAASNSAAKYIVKQSVHSIQKRGLFTLVLAGGSTPRTLYSLLASPTYTHQLDWTRTHFFWGDERCVSPDDPESNYAMSKGTILSKIQIPPDNIHRMEIDASSPDQAAKEYENKLRFFFNSPQKIPSFDLVLLGMGNDGHTASLFPGNPSLDEKDRLVVATEDKNASPAVPRITLTLPILNEAKDILFLISGEQKGNILKDIMDHPQEAKLKYPAARIRAKDQLMWYYSETP